MRNGGKDQCRRYSGLVIDVDVETVTLPDGQQLELEIIQHPGGAAVVAVDAGMRVCLLRQYRHIAADWLWELPAGKIDDGEAPLLTAQRELSEEAGLKAERWQELGSIYSSPGVFKEVVHLYLAQGLEQTATAHEAGEVIEVEWLDLQQAIDWAQDGQIVDAKTVIGLFRAAKLLDPDQ